MSTTNVLKCPIHIKGSDNQITDKFTTIVKVAFEFLMAEKHFHLFIPLSIFSKESLSISTEFFNSEAYLSLTIYLILILGENAKRT